jgi:hypothetical protein
MVAMLWIPISEFIGATSRQHAKRNGSEESASAKREAQRRVQGGDGGDGVQKGAQGGDGDVHRAVSAIDVVAEVERDLTPIFP